MPTNCQRQLPTAARYGLEVEYLSDGDFKRGLEQYLARSGVQVILLGTRRWGPAWLAGCPLAERLCAAFAELLTARPLVTVC